jgi:hypothetical protein
VIRPLRRAHRSAFVALALGLPLLLAAAWSARRAPIRQELGPELLPTYPDDSDPDPHAWADELVYWTRTPVEGLTSLPADAELIGSARSGALGIERPAGTHGILYSLEHGRVLSVEGVE